MTANPDLYFDRADVKEFWAFRDYLRASDLSTAARLVAVDIWFHMRIAHLEASPTRATLARNTGLSESTVKRALVEIRDCAFFAVTGGGRGQADRYKFRLIVPEKTLFELREMLSERPKAAKSRGSNCTPKQQFRGSNTSIKGVNLTPEYNLEDKTDDEQQRSVDNQNPFDEDALRAHLLTAAGDALSPVTRHGFANLAIPRKWLAAGCDLHADIVPTIRQVSRRIGGGVQSWDYFTQEIINAKARRESPLPVAAVRVASPSHTVVDFAERRRKSLAAAMEMAKEFGFHG